MAEDDDRLERLRAGIDALVRVLKITDATELPDGGPRLNPSDQQTLGFILAHEDCIGADLAKFLRVSATTVSAIVDRLARKNLVVRRRTDANRRVVLLQATPEGRAAAQAIIDQQRRHCALMLDALRPEDRAAFVDHVATIARAIERTRMTS